MNGVLVEVDEARRVRDGAEWLDARSKAWAAAINLLTFNIESCSDCVLGQLGDDYWDALDVEGEGALELFGFDALELYDDEEYARLDTAWRREIAKRLMS